MSIEKNRSLVETFLEDIYHLPDGEKIKQCIQCGTCSASCPTSYAMDYTPREIIAALRAEMLDRVLKSNTVWLCTSCYSCTVRCPNGIKFTDVMYELKRLGIKYGILPKGKEEASIISRTFVKMVEKYGRNPEVMLMAKYFLKTNPFRILGFAPMGLKLLLKGRAPIFPEKIGRHEDILKIMKHLESRGEA